MYSYIKILSRIELFAGEKMRKSPIVSGYRPAFDFPGTITKLSGRIDLINNDTLEPGMIETVKITFIKGIINDRHFIPGEKFTFSEGMDILGKGEIVEVISLESNTPPYVEV